MGFVFVPKVAALRSCQAFTTMGYNPRTRPMTSKPDIANISEEENTMLDLTLREKHQPDHGM